MHVKISKEHCHLLRDKYWSLRESIMQLVAWLGSMAILVTPRTVQYHVHHECHPRGTRSIAFNA